MRKTVTRHVVSAVALLSLILAPALLAAPGGSPAGELIKFTGKLKDTNGRPLVGTYTLVFQIFDAARGGEPRWQEKHDVALEDGAYTVLLGGMKPIKLRADEDYVLFVQPEGMDEALEQYRVVVAVKQPGEVGTASGERGVYRLKVERKTGVRDVKDAPEEPAADPEGATIAKIVKPKPIRTITSASGLIITPPSGTVNPLDPLATLQIDVDPNFAGPPGPPGPTGPSGPSGPTGETGPVGALVCATLESAPVSVGPGGGFGFNSPICDAANGFRLTGGGWNMFNVTQPFVTWQSSPDDNGGDFWTCRGINPSGGTAQVMCYARCCRIK